MALQTCFPDSIESWIWRIEPQVIQFLPKSINVFWGGVKIPKPCPGNNLCDYLEDVQYNQPFWLIIEPFCICNKLLYYCALYKKSNKKQWLLVEQRLIDVDISPGFIQHSVNRYYGNENYHPSSLLGCGIRFPFDTKSTLTSFLQQVSLWELTSEVTSGSFIDFHLFDPNAEVIKCDDFSCRNREPGWYVSFVLLDAQPDLRSQPQLPPP